MNFFIAFFVLSPAMPSTEPQSYPFWFNTSCTIFIRSLEIAILLPAFSCIELDVVVVVDVVELDTSATPPEYSCAVTPQVRQTGNRLSGLAGTAYASLLT